MRPNVCRLLVLVSFLWVVPMAQAATHTVTINSTSDFGTLNIAFGDTVIWRNETSLGHNIAACVSVTASPTRQQIADCNTTGGRFGSSVMFGPGVELTRATFDQMSDSGATYPYKCEPHRTMMQGRIVVAPGFPLIDADPGDFSAFIREGESPESQTLAIANAGPSTLVYSLSDDAPWLSLSECVSSSCTATNETDFVSLDFSTAGLEPGTYLATIQVSSPNATNSPQSLDVNLTVNGFSLDQLTIPSPDGEGGDQFGWSVSISGDSIAIGARQDDDVAAAGGSAYVYRDHGAGYELEQKLIDPGVGPLGLLGQSISLDGDRVLVGGADVGSGVSRATVFVRTESTWTLEDVLLEGAGGSLFSGFGFSVSLEDDLAAVGAPFDDEGADDAGAVYIFRRSGSTWIFEQKIIGNTVADGEFGRAVALSNSKVAIGAPGRNGIWIYTRFVNLQTGEGFWIEEDNLRFSTDRMGFSIDLDGNRLVMGSDTEARALVLRFRRNFGVPERSVDELTPLVPSAASGRFGESVAIHGSRILVGDSGADFADDASGAAYLFSVQGRTWTERQRFGDSNGASFDGFGQSVALQDDTLVVGAQSRGPDGAALVFEPPFFIDTEPLDVRVSFSNELSGLDDVGGNWNEIQVDPNFRMVGPHRYPNLTDFPTASPTVIDLEWSGYVQVSDSFGGFDQDFLSVPVTEGYLFSSQPDPSGTFVFSDVPAGSYRVEVVAVGFRNAVTLEIEVNDQFADRSADGVTTGLDSWDSRNDGTLASDWLIWNGVSPVGDTITVTVEGGGNNGNGIAALRVSSVPEPAFRTLSSFALLTLAAIARLGRRRRAGATVSGSRAETPSAAGHAPGSTRDT